MSYLDDNISAELERMGLLKPRISPVVLGAKLRLMFVLGGLLAAFFPSLYVALIPLAVWALYRFGLDRNGTILSAGVLLAGSLLILSLLKPLVTRPAPGPEPHSLSPEKQPLLFALVQSLASNIGVAASERIAVDCNVNCYCMFAGGFRGLFRSGVVLVIGLPVVAGLRLDQFVGILAHELGHALLITTMRSTRLIWTVHAWLSRVACQQDEFDEFLLRRIETASNAMTVVLRLSQLLVQPGRRVLWLLMIIEGAATSFFRRNIEIAADRLQIRVSGSDRFISAVLEMNLLAVAAQRAMVELSRMKRAGQLVDDYPGLIAYIRSRYPADFVQRLLASLREEKTGMLSAHPCDKDRIVRARAEHQPDIVTADLPASVLFSDYQTLCREVTMNYYRQELRLTPEGGEVMPIETALNHLDSRAY